MNETVDTADILEAPVLKWRGDWRSLYTVMIVDFGVDQEGSNFIHYMEHNVRKSRFHKQGVENVEYLAPWGFVRNADNTAIVDTGDAAVHPLGILVFKQSGSIDVTEVAKGCSVPGIFGRTQDISSLIEKYSLGQPVAGFLFWTKYSEAADEINCYVSKCTGSPFPFPIPGLTDQPECQ